MTPAVTPAAGADRRPVVVVDDLHVGFPRRGGGTIEVVRGVSFELAAGETLGLVGESGSGKSMIASSIIDLIPTPGAITGGRVTVGGDDVTTMPPPMLRSLRGKRVGMVFQDPLSGLNPVRTIGSTLTESIRRHQRIGRKAAMALAGEALHAVGIPSPRERLRAYPHELSGGLRQRVMIALALANDPQLIIADEPTTALDTTIQAQILDLLARRVETAALILITHDLGVAAQMCQRLAVVYHGRVVEQGRTSDVLENPRHPYTAGLLAAIPSFERRPERLVAITGSPPPANREIDGCAFAARCPHRDTTCTAQRPPLTDEPHAVACWWPRGAATATAETLT